MTDETYTHVHEFKCTGCDASGPRLEQRPEPWTAPMVPAALVEAAKHPYKGRNDTDASMLREAAKRIEGGYEAGGSNTKATVARVLKSVAALLDAADTPRDEPCNYGAHFAGCKHEVPIQELFEGEDGQLDVRPAAPPERCLVCLHPFDGHEGLTCAEMEAKHGVVPPESVCRCGHAWTLHQAAVCYGRNEVTGQGFCKCNVSAPIPARVPVNDEAEASTVESFAPLLTPEERASLVRNLADGPLRYVGRMRTIAHILGLCPIRSRYLRWRIHLPFWAEDKTAQMLGIAQFGCPTCGYGAIKERDALAARQGGNSDE